MDRRFIFLLTPILLGLVVSACSGAPAPGPVVAVETPLGYMQLREGDTVTVQATATDQTGVQRIELWVDGKVVHTDVVPVPGPVVSMEQTWSASAGLHVITLRAYNVAGTASDDVSISVAVNQSPLPAAGSPATAEEFTVPDNVDGAAADGVPGDALLQNPDSLPAADPPAASADPVIPPDKPQVFGSVTVLAAPATTAGITTNTASNTTSASIAAPPPPQTQPTSSGTTGGATTPPSSPPPPSDSGGSGLHGNAYGKGKPKH